MNTSPKICLTQEVRASGCARNTREMAAGSGVTLEIVSDVVSRIEGAVEAVSLGVVPARLLANREYAEYMTCDAEGANFSDEVRAPLYDPQTAVGLFIGVAPDFANRLMRFLVNAIVPVKKIGDVRERRFHGTRALGVVLQ